MDDLLSVVFGLMSPGTIGLWLAGFLVLLVLISDWFVKTRGP